MPLYRDVLSAEWFQKCARHTVPTTARTQQFGFYCDDCARRLTVEAFNGRAPMYHGETVSGTCGLCNERGKATLRAWFVCGICWNVVIAYQKSLVATRAIQDVWNTVVHPRFPQLELRETDKIRVEQFARRLKTKKEEAKLIRVLDFLVFEHGTEERTVFYIEQKSGPGSVEEMKEFQLDVNDYDDILGVSLNSGLPGYVFHVQLDLEYENGTRRVVPRAIWWTDIVRLRAALKRVGARRGEDKRAAYFRLEAFQPIDTFVAELEGNGPEMLAEQIKSKDLILP